MAAGSNQPPVPASPGLAGLANALQARVDPLGWSSATLTVLGRAVANPAGLASATAHAAAGAAALPAAVWLNALGVDGAPSVAGDPRDPRFRDPAWAGNPYFFALRQLHGIVESYADDVLAAGRQGDAGDVHDLKAALATRLLVDALSPTNYPATNPEVLVTALRTGGKSLVRGAQLALADLRERKGMPLKADPDAFTLGRDLAATAGSVVFRNDLIELIQYAPRTPQVRARPLLCSPPWINKYYVMDLSPDRSFVQWAVDHERTVFMISYRNPDESMRDLTFDDYLTHGVLAALDVVSEISGSEIVDVAALCVGGAMAAMAAAHLAARQEERIGTLSLLNTMLDYSAPGELAGFVDAATLQRIETRMHGQGFLPADDMALTFDLLRARDLIFRYIPTRWLQGEQPAAFDILAWNDDSTRMPAAMHQRYLRELYGENRLACGVMDLGGRRLDLGALGHDTYVVGAINDHIVPWPASYATTRLLGGPVRYVLSSGGHIAGIVNPPSPKAWFEATEPGRPYPDGPDGAENWRQGTSRTSGSWWQDWEPWAARRAGDLGKPPRLGSRKHPAGEPAPGVYVRA